MAEEKHDEKWLLSKGWERVKGYRVESDLMNTDHEVSFWSKDAFDDFVKECIFYQNLELNDEFASDDLDDCIEMQEEYDEE